MYKSIVWCTHIHYERGRDMDSLDKWMYGCMAVAIFSRSFFLLSRCWFPSAKIAEITNHNWKKIESRFWLGQSLSKTKWFTSFLHFQIHFQFIFRIVFAALCVSGLPFTWIMTIHFSSIKFRLAIITQGNRQWHPKTLFFSSSSSYFSHFMWNEP